MTQEEHNQENHTKEVTIIVNGRPKAVAAKELSFDQVVALADNLPSGPNVMFTVTYGKGPDPKHEGSLVEGQTVKIKNGMVFNVTATDKS